VGGEAPNQEKHADGSDSSHFERELDG
jgi:hypothetical protein